VVSDCGEVQEGGVVMGKKKRKALGRADRALPKAMRNMVNQKGGNRSLRRGSLGRFGPASEVRHIEVNNEGRRTKNLSR